MDTKKIAATFAILMITLSMAGFAYAHWSKIVTIDGSVTTGTLHVTPSFYMELYQDKPVATYGYDVYPEDNYMELWIDNVYPCLWVNGWIDLECDGSVPVALKDIIVTGTETVTCVYNEEMEYYELYDNGDLIAILMYEFDFPDGYPQIDPGSTAYIYFMMHFEEGLPQYAYYWFNIQLEFWNWNEVI